MTKNLPRVAVVMATYNGAKHIEAQLQSLMRQQHVVIHVFFRDDGSTDETLEIVRLACRRHPNVLRLVSDGRGPQRSPGKNFLLGVGAVDLAHYDYLALSDQDDVWLLNKVETAIKVLTEIGADGYSSDLAVWDGGRKVSYLKKGGRQTEYDYLFQTASAGCTYVLTSRAARAVQQRVTPLISQLDQLTAHDLIIYAVVRASGMRWVHDDRPLMLYRQHGGNTYGSGNVLTTLQNKLRLIRSNWYGTIVQDAILTTRTEEKFIADMFSTSLGARLRSLGALNKTRREPAARLLLAFLILSGVMRRRRAAVTLASGAWK